MADNQPTTPKTAHANKSIGRFWIGLATLSAIGLMGMSAWRQGWFTPTDHLFLELDKGAQGLQVGTLVKLKGFKIGEVDGMTLESNLNVRISMRVTAEKLTLLGADAHVKLSRDTPISAKYIEIIPGEKPQGSLLANAALPIKEGGEVEDMLLIVKNGVEKLNSALSKIEPILDDTKKLTGEAAAIRSHVHSAVNVVLDNLQDVSGSAKQIGHTVQGITTSINADRAVIMGQVKGALNDVKKITESAVVDLPPTLRSTRLVTEDVAEITDGAKKTWPISSFINSEAAAKPLKLDAFEAGK